MMARMTPAPKYESPEAGPVEDGDEAQILGEEVGRRLQEEGQKHEDAPQPVDDAGHGRQQIDGVADGAPQPLGRVLGQKECHPHAERHRDDQAITEVMIVP